MLVRYVPNSIDTYTRNGDLHGADRKHRLFVEELHLTPSTEYVVYAIAFGSFAPQFYVADDCFATYPVAYEARHFEMVDERCSKYWELRSEQRYWSQLMLSPPAELVTFAPWAQGGQRFYERLVEGDEREERVFAQYRELMELEYARPGITKIASRLKDSWTQCPYCYDAWEDAGTGELQRCPSCGECVLRALSSD